MSGTAYIHLPFRCSSEPEVQQREAEREAARARPTAGQWSAEAYWQGLAEEGRKLRQVDRERQGQRPEQERE